MIITGTPLRLLLGHLLRAASAEVLADVSSWDSDTRLIFTPRPIDKSFLSKRDAGYMSQLRASFFRVNIPKVVVYPLLDPEPKDLDTLYQEVDDPSSHSTLGPAIDVRIYTRANPAPTVYKSFGVEKIRNVQFFFDRHEIDQKKYQPRIGDRLVFENEVYLLTEVFRDIETYRTHKADFKGYSFVGFGVKIRASSLHQPEAALTVSKETFLTSYRDLAYIESANANIYNIALPKALFFKRPDDTFADPLYGEIADPDFLFWDQFNLPVFQNFSAQDDTFTKVGDEETRPIEISFSRRDIEDRKIATPSIGWMVALDGELYTINSISRGDYLASLGSLSWNAKAWKVKPSSTPGASNNRPEANDKSTFFLKVRDLHHFGEAQTDLYLRTMEKIRFYHLEDKAEFSDPLYLENTAEYRVAGTPYDVPAYLHVNPNRSTLKKHGISTSRDLSMYVTNKILELYNVPIPHVGDTVMYEGEPYIITDQDPAYYVVDTENFTGYSYFLKRQKQSTFDSGVDPEPAPTGPYRKPSGPTDEEDSLYG